MHDVPASPAPLEGGSHYFVTRVSLTRGGITVIHTIVVPLDGSPFAEQALEPAHQLAHRFRAAIELVRVFEPTVSTIYASGAPVIDPRLDQDLRAKAKAYLDAVADRERVGANMPVMAMLLDGPVVETLAKHVAALERALVVMTTHGRSGIGRVVLGSVTDGLIRSASVPVLTIRVKEDATSPTSSRFSRALIPIAGAEFGADMAERTVELFGTEGVDYVLFHAIVPVPIIPPAEPMIPVVYPDLDAEKAAANLLLGAMAGPLRARGAHVITQIMIDADPAHAIVDYATKNGIDFISMATHGLRGVKRLMLGSVTDKVLRSASVPVLVFRPPKDSEAKDHAVAGRAASGAT
jgi:nucleotide-binding universal stress UspA family protein